MNKENMNCQFLDKVLSGEIVDYWYHLGTDSSDTSLALMKDLKAVILAGSGNRIDRMAHEWAERHGTQVMLKFSKDERFTLYYVNDVLFSSHGMGMPSASIAIQELLKLVYVVKEGNLEEMDKVFWSRVGTSGGLTEPGTVVVTSEGLQSDFKPYRLLSLGKEVYFDCKFPESCNQDIIAANKDEDFPIIAGKTIACNSFYIEQNRIDGGICLNTEAEKLLWLKEAEKIGVRNLEMEAAMIAGFLNYWGFSKSATMCCVLVNRLEGDQVTASREELAQYSINAETALWNYLEKFIF
jgi:uridine phosphorylase